MEPADLRAQIADLQASVRARNWREGGAAVIILGVAASLLIGLPPHPTIQAGLVAMVLTAIEIVVVLARFGRGPDLDLTQPDEVLAAAARRAVAAQARLLQWAPVWYVAPLSVSSAVVLRGLEEALRTPLPWPITAVVVATFIGVALLNLHAARALLRTWAV